MAAPVTALERPPAALDRIRTAEGLFVVDDQQRIVTWSTAAEHLFGRSAREVLGRPCHEALGVPGERPDCRATCRIVLEARRGRAVAHHDIHATHADGHLLTLRASAFIAPNQAEQASPAAGEPRPLVYHLVRPRTGTPRRSRRHPVEHTEAAAAAHEAVPPLAAPLTPRELEVLHLLAIGRSTQEIAEELTISRLTARNHVLNLEQKLGAHNRVAVVFNARQHGLI